MAGGFLVKDGGYSARPPPGRAAREADDGVRVRERERESLGGRTPQSLLVSRGRGARRGRQHRACTRARTRPAGGGGFAQPLLGAEFAGNLSFWKLLGREVRVRDPSPSTATSSACSRPAGGVLVGTSCKEMGGQGGLRLVMLPCVLMWGSSYSPHAQYPGTTLHPRASQLPPSPPMPAAEEAPPFLSPQESEDLERQNAALRREIRQLTEEMKHFTSVLSSHEPLCSILASPPPPPPEVLYATHSFHQPHISSPRFQH